METLAQRLGEALEQLHVISLPSIELLQKSFPNNHQLMINISTLLDPRYVFLIYAPLLFALNRQVGHRLVAALSLAEWANQVLKWLLAGDRPYWYAQELNQQLLEQSQSQNETFQTIRDSSQQEASSTSFLLDGYKPVELRQFPVTCELGAGSPSGHAMVTATVWYVLLEAYLRGELLPASRLWGTHKVFAKLSWSAYGLILILVSLSRVYLACHFPHQCICGALLGLATAKLVVGWLPMESLKRRHFALATLLMFASAMATFQLLQMRGLDPLWSVRKGLRWCARPDYIHLDTTPFASMTRYLGFCLGAGLAFEPTWSSSKKHGGGEGGQLEQMWRRLVTFALAYLFGQLLLWAPKPSDLSLFYLATFLTYTLFAWAIAGPIPKLTRLLWPTTTTTTTTMEQKKLQ